MTKSPVAALGAEIPEIPWKVSEAIGSWQRTLNQTLGGKAQQLSSRRC